MSPQPPIDLLSLPFQQFIAQLGTWRIKPFWAEKVWHNIYRNGHYHLDDMPELKDSVRHALQTHSTLHLPAVISQQAADETEKFAVQLTDGTQVECVAMHFERRSTACISTQAGCAMGCRFCATGGMGLQRHLTSGEIVAQLLLINRHLAAQQKAAVDNIVFMGMGEPLHNYDQSMQAVSIFLSQKGLAVAPRHVTISTVGLPEKIRQLAGEPYPVQLAVSLHAANDDLRASLIPAATRWPLHELMEACDFYSRTRKRRVFFEWALIDGVNDRREDAVQLAQLLAGRRAHVNLIPLNAVPDSQWRPSPMEQALQFQSWLTELGVRALLRQSKGQQIAAGCGQLATHSSTHQ